MEKVRTLLDKCQAMGWVPKHDCSRHKKILTQTQSVNSLNNPVICRESICKICGNVFWESIPSAPEVIK